MKHILIVDDEPEQLRSFRVGLKTRGYKTVEASSAQSALKQLHDDLGRVALVLTDYAMPGMDGLSLVRKIRGMSEGLPVIVMTAHGNATLKDEVLRSGCDGFMEKPFTLDELIQEIKRVERRGVMERADNYLERASLRTRSTAGYPEGESRLDQTALSEEPSKT